MASSAVNAEIPGSLPFRPGLNVHVEKIDAEAARHESEQCVRLRRGRFSKLGREVGRVERHQGFLDDLAFVCTLNPAMAPLPAG